MVTLGVMVAIHII